MKRLLLILGIVGFIGSANASFDFSKGEHKEVRQNGDVVKVINKNDGRIEKTYHNGKLILKQRFFDKSGKSKTLQDKR